MIPALDFGRTGHQSSRILFGAAALMQSTEAESQQTVELLLEHGVNHIDVAARYGYAEIWVGGWMREHRDRFFLATKTHERSYAAARDQIRASLERLQVDCLDLIQLHNLVDEEEWQLALSEGGALRAAVEAREEGLVRFIGVTGHGTRVARMHLRSLERFHFDSVLLPYSYAQIADEIYAREFDQLAASCVERGVAIQTIKAIARRRWAEGVEPSRTTWYEPLEAQADIDAAVAWALDRGEIFVNSPSDVTLLARVLFAAERWSREGRERAEIEMERAAREQEIAPLFLRGFGVSSS
jgi:aryl-alcohol dehydrogenase-like predicted oxidoreductase